MHGDDRDRKHDDHAAISQPIAKCCGTGRGGTIGSRFARLGASFPSSDVTFTSSGSVSIRAGSPRRSEFGPFVDEFDRHRPDQVLAGVRGLQLIVKPTHVARARLRRPLAVVANDKVAHGLSERRRLDLDVGLRLDGRLPFPPDRIAAARAARRAPNSFTGPFSAFRSIAFSDGGGDGPVLSRHSAAG